MNRHPLIVAALLAILASACGGGGKDSDTNTTAGSDGTSDTIETTNSSGSSTTVGMSSTTDGPDTVEPTTDPTTGSTTDPTTDPTTTEPTTTSPFLIDPDEPSDIQCSTIDDDCPEGQKCTAYNNDGGSTWNATKCVEVMGSGVHGEPCQGQPLEGLDDCADGHMCWDIDPQTLEGTCLALCVGGWDNPMCEPEDTKCYIGSEGTLTLCLPNCDLLVQDCPPGEGCYLLTGNEQTICLPTDAPDNEGLAGDACSYYAECQPGLACIENVPDCEGYCCSPYCDLGDPMCPAGTECVAAFQWPLPDEEHVGICTEPG